MGRTLQWLLCHFNQLHDALFSVVVVVVAWLQWECVARSRAMSFVASSLLQIFALLAKPRLSP